MIKNDAIAREISQRTQGDFFENYPLAKWTWLRVGGPAQYFLAPTSIDDVQNCIKYNRHQLPLTLLGGCSNLIIRDGGIAGLCLYFGRHFSHIEHSSHTIIAYAGCPVSVIARHGQLAGIGGLAFLCAIPGSLGGSVAMNAGAHGREIGDAIKWVDIITSEGEIQRLDRADIDFSYRSTKLPEGAIVIRAALTGPPQDPEIIKHEIDKIKEIRAQSQPRHVRTGGSTFKNPPADVSPQKAWQLVDEAGCRGLTMGDAQVSPKHCNFLINNGHARASDLEDLGEEVRRRVYETSNVTLQWEIKRLGRK